MFSHRSLVFFIKKTKKNVKNCKKLILKIWYDGNSNPLPPYSGSKGRRFEPLPEQGLVTFLIISFDQHVARL